MALMAFKLFSFPYTSHLTIPTIVGLLLQLEASTKVFTLMSFSNDGLLTIFDMGGV
jgi:hypothetical protein